LFRPIHRFGDGAEAAGRYECKLLLVRNAAIDSSIVKVVESPHLCQPPPIAGKYRRMD
jgi:hypothetical protein